MMLLHIGDLVLWGLVCAALGGMAALWARKKIEKALSSFGL
ncbi:hypothetical protein [Ferribacterium limneticum]|nr:hypothetical protein [Ferribacterium limneticum]